MARKNPIEPYVRSAVSASAISASGASDDAHRMESTTSLERDGRATRARCGRTVARVVVAVRARVVGVATVRVVAIVVGRRVRSSGRASSVVESNDAGV